MRLLDLLQRARRSFNEAGVDTQGLVVASFGFVISQALLVTAELLERSQ